MKIHLPWRTESRYAEVMNLKLPIKRFITISVKNSDNENNVINGKSLLKIYNLLKKMWEYFLTITEYDYTLIEKEPSFYSATAGGKPEEQFIVKDRMTHYNSAQRSLIVFQILLRAKFDEGEKCGIRRLLNDGTYQSVFPLHEGRYDKPHANGSILDRRVIDKHLIISVIVFTIFFSSIKRFFIWNGLILLKHFTNVNHYAWCVSISAIKLPYTFAG